MANTSILFILLVIFILSLGRKAFLMGLYLTLLSGFGTWLIGRPSSIHIGASGLIFAFLGFLTSLGFFQRSFKNILISVLILSFYSGALWGVLPTSSHISWEGHLSGFLAGVLVCKWKRKKNDNPKGV
jgi:membrane associated rhomboid family serine protease